MQFGHMSILLACLAVACGILVMAFNWDLDKIAANLGMISIVLLVILSIIEWRRRSKKFDK